MKELKGALALGLAVAACAVSPAGAQPAPVVPLDHLPALKGDYFRWSSAAVGRDYHIYVRLPDGYEAAPEKRYPVVYLLDGDSLFPMLAPAHLFLTYDEKLPEAIVVGIAYGGFGEVNKRSIDYSAPGAEGEPAPAGAPAFHSFLKRELLPEVERRYRADPNCRIMFGQSLGGSFALYSAFSDPDLFWGRIASNPVISRWRKLFFGPAPAATTRRDLHLVLTSGSRDRPALRSDALAWFKAWEGRPRTAWTVRPVTIEGGTHAASAAEAYRAGLLSMFGPAAPPGPCNPD